MKKYLAIFTCSEDSENNFAWQNLNVEEKKEKLEKGILAEKEWEIKYNGRIISSSKTTGKGKLLNSKGCHEIDKGMGRIVVFQAETLEEAASIFDGHPHFSYFPGDGIKVVECE